MISYSFCDDGYVHTPVEQPSLQVNLGYFRSNSSKTLDKEQVCAL